MTYGTDLRWLVTDQLGTPRIVVDQSGSLLTTKRHDYLPFGEELFDGTGGRTTTMGYSAVDGVRQKFTGCEHDGETGLEFAHARYYGSSQGRFISTDPFLGSGRILLPQSWNRYTYVLNNPLRLVDPTGLGDEDPLQRPPPPTPAPLPPVIPPIRSELEGRPDYVEKKAQAPQISITVTPDKPSPVVNAPLPDGDFATGIGSVFTIQVTDEAGHPIPGLDVMESNDTRNDTNGLQTRENPFFVQTNANGIFFDLVTGNAATSSQPLSPSDVPSETYRQIESATSVTTEQRLTILAPGYGVLGTAVYSRTFTNMDGTTRRQAINSRGNHVNNFTVTTTPVTMSYP